MYKLLVIGAAIIGIKMLVFFVTATLKKLPKTTLSAEEVIQCRHMHPQRYKEMWDSQIHVIERDSEIEEEYEELRDMFRDALQNKRLTRPEILGIKKYLQANLKEYEKKKWKNDAHCIYTLFKAIDLNHKHIETVKIFLTR